MDEFFGHDKGSLRINLFAASYPLGLTAVALLLLRSGNTLGGAVTLFFLLHGFGYPTYLMMEVKHLRPGDLPGNQHPLARFVFGLLGVLGAILAIATILCWVSAFALLMPPNWRFFAWSVVVFVLAFLSAFGGVLGLMDVLVSLPFELALHPIKTWPEVQEVMQRLRRSRHFQVIVWLLTAGFAIASWSIELLFLH